MCRKLAVFLMFFVFLLSGDVSAAVTDQDFSVKTTQNLINLCTASADDPLQKQAVHFCEGFLVGAYMYHVAENSGPEGKLLVCLPEKNPPTRNEAIAMFLEWAKAHSQYMGENPVETEFRFLTEKWPCKH